MQPWKSVHYSPVHTHVHPYLFSSLFVAVHTCYPNVSKEFFNINHFCRAAETQKRHFRPMTTMETADKHIKPYFNHFLINILYFSNVRSCVQLDSLYCIDNLYCIDTNIHLGHLLTKYIIYLTFSEISLKNLMDA